jgi:septum formation protein
MKPVLILASQSPRRKELLSQLGYQFQTISADIDESIIDNESPSDYVLRLAIEKATVVSKNQVAGSVVLGSDTSVIFDNHILGKPENIAAYQTTLTKY